MRELAGYGLRIGDSGAAPLAALRAVAGEGRIAGRVLLLATEGPTDPEGYAAVVGAPTRQLRHPGKPRTAPAT